MDVNNPGQQVIEVFSDSMYRIFFWPCMAIFAILIIGVVSWFLVSNAIYKKSTYYNLAHKPFLKMKLDKGAHGEYLTYEYLKDYEKKGARFLFQLLSAHR